LDYFLEVLKNIKPAIKVSRKLKKKIHFLNFFPKLFKDYFFLNNFKNIDKKENISFFSGLNYPNVSERYGILNI